MTVPFDSIASATTRLESNLSALMRRPHRTDCRYLMERTSEDRIRKFVVVHLNGLGVAEQVIPAKSGHRFVRVMVFDPRLGVVK